MHDNGGGNSRKKELDDFWNIDMIVPKRKTQKPAPRRSTETVEITVSSVLESLTDDKVFKSEKLSGGEGGVIKKYISENTPQPEPLYSYSLQNSLVHNVRVYKKPSNYAYYENFYRDALKYLNEKSDKAERAPFFSYVPQYDQLNPAQLAYYLYFREQARSGNYIDADYSYIMLYIYEILNLGDKMDLSFGQSQLCGLWNAYREKHGAIGRQLSDWMCEYSLINRLPPPSDIEIRNIPRECVYKEYLLVNRGVGYDYYAEALLAFSSAYDFRRSKFATGERSAVFEKYIPAALSACIAHLSTSGGVLSGVGFNDSTISRDAYIGALCSHRAKYKIELDYCSFSRTNDLRYLVGDIVKYSENKIRAYFGIKSRLSCYSLDSDIRELLDNFFDTHLVKRSRPARKEKREEYDALYELPTKPLSLSDASRIEEESWETTRSLVEAFDEEESDAEQDSVPSTENSIAEETVAPASEEDDGLLNALGELLPFVLAVYRGDGAAQRKFAQERGRMSDSIVDSINEISADTIGDILIEDDGGAYRIVEDYEFYFEASED
ncbi:MAG: TerB N-terminal domain-containing protein [Clostridia bacterium]|nr:TerB N-terminal domain-containing protein [Clostridia bacterium]